MTDAMKNAPASPFSALAVDSSGATPDSFDYWWNVPGEWVEPPNERRNGWSGMLRVQTNDGLLYVKRQRNHLCRTLLHPFGWPTTSREWHYLHRLRQLGLNVPEPVFHAVRSQGADTEAVLVTRNLLGFTALDAQLDLDGEQRERLADALGADLARMHQARLQHSCLYDKHIMVRWQDATPTVALIDLEKMRPRLWSRSAARHDLKQLRRHQRIFREQEWARLLHAYRDVS